MPDVTSEEVAVHDLDDEQVNQACMKADVTGWQNLDREARIDALHDEGIDFVNVVTTTDVVDIAVELVVAETKKKSKRA